MPGTKISALTTRASPQSGDFFVLADADEALNYKITFSDLVTAFGGTSVPTYTKLLDEVSPSVSYLGEANPATLHSAASWRISRITTVGNDVSVEYADNGNFSQIWNNRLSLSYN